MRKHRIIKKEVNRLKADILVGLLQKYRMDNKMVRNNSKKNKILFLIIILVVLISCLICISFYQYMIKKQVVEQQRAIINDGLYPVKDVMISSGYKEDGAYIFKKDISGKEIVISFDFDEKLCKKNLYIFSLHNKIRRCENIWYVEKGELESILNCKIAFEKDKVISSPIKYVQHEWTKFPPLVAHAGGTIREKQYNSFYTNSLDALISNYNLGHRVFEFDFYLTSDRKLAAVHDWTQFGNLDGVALSSEEWKNFQTFGSPITEGRYTTMLIEDLLDEMLVNKDIFIITDTKAFEITEEEAKLQFQLIYDEAMKRDPELLNRVIPQIYNEEMYDMVSSVYEFPSIIYTVYATSSSGDEIISFSSQRDNIKVITAPVNDARFDETTINKLHESGLLIYNHTIHTYADLTIGKAKGIDGFYTGLLLPSDVDLYEKLEEKVIE